MNRTHRAPRRVATTSALALAALLVLAGPVSAHPFVEGFEAPVDSLAALTLDLGHGCPADGEEGGHSHGEEEGGHSHGDGEEEPTTEVALEIPDAMWVYDVPEVEGFEVELERADDGEIEVVTWTATTASEPAPRFPIEVVIDGEPGDELHLRVFQACDDFTYRWVGTPDEPAEDPAVSLDLVDADPDAPAPDREDSPLFEGEVATEDDTGTEGSGTSVDDEGLEESPATEDEVEDADEGAEEGEEEGLDAEAAPISAPTDPETSPLLWSVVALVGGILLIGLILALRRRPVADGAPEGEADDTTDANP